MKTRFFELPLLVIIAAVASAPRAADMSAWKLPPETAAFKPAPGAELLTAQCLICHSADYVSTQPPLNQAGWSAIVAKMREKYGAPIATNTVDAMVAYLAKNYGPANPPK